MSISSEISRIEGNRNTIRNKLVNFGLVSSSANLDACADAIDEIANNGSVSASVQEGDTYTIPKGYHNGSGTVSGVAGGGNYQLQSKTVIPTKQQQTITPDSGNYGLSDVTVQAIPENYQDVSSVTATADDVLANKIFVDSTGISKAGTMINNGAVAKTLTPSDTSYTIPKGYHNGLGSVGISIEEKEVTPTKAIQNISPTSGKVLSSVKVNAIPDEYITTTDADAIAANILEDKTAYVQGNKVTGTMPDNGAINSQINGLDVISYSIPAGYTSGGSISLSNDIETALAAI